MTTISGTKLTLISLLGLIQLICRPTGRRTIGRRTSGRRTSLKKGTSGRRTSERRTVRP